MLHAYVPTYLRTRLYDGNFHSPGKFSDQPVRLVGKCSSRRRVEKSIILRNLRLPARLARRGKVKGNGAFSPSVAFCSLSLFSDRDTANSPEAPRPHMWKANAANRIESNRMESNRGICKGSDTLARLSISHGARERERGRERDRSASVPYAAPRQLKSILPLSISRDTGEIQHFVFLPDIFRAQADIAYFFTAPAVFSIPSN